MTHIDAIAFKRRRMLATGVAAMGALGAARAQVSATNETTKAVLPLTVQTTEGPYYLHAMPMRADITEGQLGVPLELRLTVMDTVGRALSNCRVDVWQCNALGIYSGFSGQGDDKRTSEIGKTYLRGGAISDTTGEVKFRSIYPGWYSGRTTHIHFKVMYEQRTVVTSQFFLPDVISEFLYTQQAQYKREQLRGVLNSSDGIALMAGTTVIGSVHEQPDRYVAQLRIVVDPQANPPVHRPGPGNRPPAGIITGGSGPPPGFGGTPLPPPLEGDARIKALLPK